MKIDFDQKILDDDGDPVLVAKKNALVNERGQALNNKDNEDLTLNRAARMGLAAADPDRSSPEQAVDDFVLALRIRESQGKGGLEITEEEAKLIGKRIKLCFVSQIVAGRAGILLKGPLGVASDVPSRKKA